MTEIACTRDPPASIAARRASTSHASPRTRCGTARRRRSTSAVSPCSDQGGEPVVVPERQTLRDDVRVDVDERRARGHGTPFRPPPWHPSQGVVNTLILSYAPSIAARRGAPWPSSHSAIPTSSSTRTRRSPSTAPRASCPNPDQGGWWVLDSETIWRLIRDPNSASDPELADPDAPITKVFKNGAAVDVLHGPARPHARPRLGEGRLHAPRGRRPRADDRRARRPPILDAAPRLRAASTSPPTFGDVLPMTVMSDFLGVEPERRDEFRIWTLTRIMGMFDPKRNGTPEFVESTVRLRELLLGADRRGRARHRCGGLVGRLVGVGRALARRDGRPAHHHARRRDHHHRRPDRQHAPRPAHHTRASSTPCAVPRSLVIPAAIEETLRYDSPALSAGRILTEDTELFGQPDGRRAPGCG